MRDVTHALDPDDLPYLLFRDFGYHLAPVITDVFNASLLQHTVPLSWKGANITPATKRLNCVKNLHVYYTCNFAGVPYSVTAYQGLGTSFALAEQIHLILILFVSFSL